MYKIAVNLFILRLVTAMINFFVLPASVKYFGISVERDIWILCTAFISTVIAVFFGPLNEIFRAKYVFIRETQGEDEALTKLRNLLIAVLTVAAILSALIAIFPWKIKIFIAPKITRENEVSAFVTMLWFCTPQIFLQVFINIGIGILNAFSVFYIPEIIGIITGLINLFCVVVLAQKISIYALVLASYIGLVLFWGAILFCLHRKKIRIWKVSKRFSFADAWVFISFALPFYLPYSIGQSSFLLERSLANILGTGVVSTIDYSRRFPMMVQTVLGSVLTAVMVPLLTQAFSKNDKPLFLEKFKQSLRITLLTISLTVSFLIGAAKPICEFFFFRGTMSMNTIADITALLRLYSVSLTGIALYLIFGLSILSQQRQRFYALAGMTAQIVMIALNLIFYRISKIYTFPVTLFFAHIITAWVMYKKLQIENKISILLEIIKYYGITAFLALIFAIQNYFLSELPSLIRICISAGLLTLLFCLMLKFVEGVNIVEQVKQRISK